MSSGRKFPEYLKTLQGSSIQSIFDTFNSFNSSDENEEFYVDKPPSKKTNFRFPAKKLYSTLDEFEAGNEINFYKDNLKNVVEKGDKNTKKCHLKDEFLIDKQMVFKKMKKKFAPEKKFVTKIFSRIDNEYHDKFQKKKNENEPLHFNFTSEKKQIVTLSTDYNFNKDFLKEYIKDYSKHEDFSKKIELISPITNQKVFLDKIYIEDKAFKKRVVSKINQQDIEQRAEMLVPSKLNEISGTMKILVRFFTLIKKKSLEKKKHLSELHLINNEIISQRRHSHSFYDKDTTSKFDDKFSNPIFSAQKLSHFFKEDITDNQTNQDIKNIISQHEAKDNKVIATLKTEIDLFQKNKMQKEKEQFQNKIREILDTGDSQDDFQNFDINNSSDKEDGDNKKNPSNDMKKQKKENANYDFANSYDFRIEDLKKYIKYKISQKKSSENKK